MTITTNKNKRLIEDEDTMILISLSIITLNIVLMSSIAVFGSIEGKSVLYLTLHKNSFDILAMIFIPIAVFIYLGMCILTSASDVLSDIRIIYNKFPLISVTFFVATISVVTMMTVSVINTASSVSGLFFIGVIMVTAFLSVNFMSTRLKYLDEGYED